MNNPIPQVKLHKLQEEKKVLLDELEKTQQGLLSLSLELEKRVEELEKTQRSLLSLSLELEKRVEERTIQLANANKELEAFSYSVSHDLSTPLQVIYGFSQLLLKKYENQLDEEGKKFLSNINHGCETMMQLIQALLSLAHVNNTALQMRQKINLSHIAREIVDQFRVQEPSRQAACKIATRVHADGDEQLLRTALQNLLGNAWKYTSKQAKAQIQFGKTKQDGVLVYFVKDNGAGFDMTQSEKLFSAFQRLHSTQEFPGTGIGLATVARIIHKHGGQIWAEGAVDQGATFYFTLRAFDNQ